MTREQFIKFKADLLCFGAALSDKAREMLILEHPHFFDKGFIDAVNMNVMGSNICVSIAEAFSENSKYVLDFSDGAYFIEAFNEKAPVRFFPQLPKTNTIIDEIAVLHADGCINIWPSTNCCYDKPDIKCKFCSLLPKTKAPIPVEVLCDGLKKLMAQVPDYTLNFSGATYKSPDIMVDYWCSLAKGIREFSNCPIAVEFAPPSDLSLLEKLKESGVTVAIMNIEIVAEELRKKICPGKSAITLEHYHKAFKKAVEVFGRGQVSSVMIGGIQPFEDIKKECEYLTSIGVFPTIMPFRPLDDCTFFDITSCNPDELIEASEYLGALLRKEQLAPECQEGCTKCGGCSIENDCYLEGKTEIRYIV